MTRRMVAGLIIVFAASAGLVLVFLDSLAFDNVTFDFYFRPLGGPWTAAAWIVLLAIGAYVLWRASGSRVR